MYAAYFGHTATVKVLLTAGAKPNLARSDGQRALHFAAKKGSAACIQMLLKHGADPETRFRLNCPT